MDRAPPDGEVVVAFFEGYLGDCLAAGTREVTAGQVLSTHIVQAFALWSSADHVNSPFPHFGANVFIR
jgi:hypothetical protein